jgi:hypothetical protein
MVDPSSYSVRRADASDEPTLAWLSALAGAPRLERPALIGHLDGRPAAAISLLDGRVVADPFQPSAALAARLPLHRSGWRGGAQPAAVAARVRRAITFAAGTRTEPDPRPS